MYVLHVVISDVTKRCGETVREKAKGNTNGLSHVPSKRKEEIKSGTSGCGSFVVAYFQPATSIDRLRVFLTRYCVKKKKCTLNYECQRVFLHLDLQTYHTLPTNCIFHIPLHIIIYSHTYIPRHIKCIHTPHAPSTLTQTHQHTHTPGTGLWTTLSEKQ